MKIKEFSKKIYTLEVIIYVFITVINMAAFNLEISFKLAHIINSFNTVLMIMLFLEFILNNIIFKITKKTIIFLVISIPIIFITFVYSGKGLLLPYLFILAYPTNLKSNDLGKTVFKTLVVAVLTIVVLCISGISSNITEIRSNGLLRQSLGFTSANALGNIITLIFLLKVFVSWKNWKKIDTCIWGVITIVMYAVTNSRMSLFLSLLILISVVIYKSKLAYIFFYNIIYKIPAIIFIINSLITFYLVYYFRTHTDMLFDFINKISSGRLTYMLSFFNTYGISAFGNRSIQFVSSNQVRNSNNYLQWAGIDNSYMYIAMLYGIVILISFVLIYYFTEKSLERNHNFGGILYLLAYAIFGLTENYMINIAINFLFFIFAEYLTKLDEKYE